MEYHKTQNGTFRAFTNGKRIFKLDILSYDGSYYVDSNDNIQPHNKGKATFGNGDVYNGEWRDGLMYGHGKLYKKGGNFLEGNFVSNRFEGEGTFANDGFTDIGTFNNSQLDGFGKRDYSKNRVSHTPLCYRIRSNRLNFTKETLIMGSLREKEW